MDKYAKMYAILCGAISDALDVLPLSVQTLHAKLILEKALRDAEILYIDDEFTSATQQDASAFITTQ